MDQVKVMHLITHLGVGGAQDNTLLTVKGHDRRRFRVDLGTGRDYTDWFERGRDYADALFVFPTLRRSVTPHADLQALREISAFFKRNQYDIVHTHSAKAGVVGRLAARLARVPIVVHTFHSFGWQVTRGNGHSMRAALSFLERWYYIVMERWVATMTDALITVCDLNKKEAVRLNIASPAKLTTIYSGIDLNQFRTNVDRAAKRAALGLDPGRPVVGTIGRLCPQKAPLDFVAAAKAALQSKPDTQFIMVGDGPMAGEVNEAIGDEPRIKVLGYRKDIPEILSILDVFVLSSLWEGLGRALTEAMIVGVPAAATAVDGVPELVTHQETGLLSAAREPLALAENIVWLLDHPAAARRMKDRAHRRVVPAFSAERMVEQIQGLYERLLQEKHYPALEPSSRTSPVSSESS